MRDAARRLRRHAVLALAALAGVLVFLVAADLFPYHSANHDEGVYLQQAAMLLDGRLALTPPVEDAFRPWFFVEDGNRLYPKYAPVPAAVFALGVALGVPRLSLALVAAANVGLTALVAREAFDHRTGLLAGALLLTSPLFVLNSAVFLPYAPTTAFNLAFAYAYLRAERDRSVRWSVGAGAAVAVAFFARPFTALLFALPFIAHACVTLARERTTAVARRRVATAALGLCGVGVALAYNWRMTGHPLVFPYQAFAPLDGIGFGHREILNHAEHYTPVLALRANAEVVHLYLTEWGPLGVAGSALAAVGLVAARRHWDWRRAVLAGVFVSVVAGNVYFWGNFNILGAVDEGAGGLQSLLVPLDVPGDGLINLLGPYYHFDLLVPSSVFAAHGLRTLARRARARLRAHATPRQARAAGAAILVASTLVLGGSTVAAFDDPVATNAGVTEEYEQAYAPFLDGAPADAVVFLPTTYGPWLNHPFQYLRNDPGYDGDTTYALQVNQFAVVDAFPGRAYYRYVHRGTWNPFDGSGVVPYLQRVDAVRGDTVRATLTLELPAGASSTSYRLAAGDGHAYYAAPAANGSQSVTLAVNATHAWVTGQNVDPTGPNAIPVAGDDDVVLVANVNRPGGGFSYRVVLPVATANGDRRALTPELEVCTVPQLCGGEAAYVPGPPGSSFTVNATVTATD